MSKLWMTKPNILLKTNARELLVFNNLTVTVSLKTHSSESLGPLNERTKLSPVYVSMCCIAVIEL